MWDPGRLHRPHAQEAGPGWDRDRLCPHRNVLCRPLSPLPATWGRHSPAFLPLHSTPERICKKTQTSEKILRVLMEVVSTYPDRQPHAHTELAVFALLCTV